MDSKRFRAITERYSTLRIAILGDFCLDRYLEIDPEKKEVSIETGLPVHNVVNVRAQAGGAGTILNNLAALGIGTIFPIGFLGEDGEGFELRNALKNQRGTSLDGLVQTASRRTFTYCKPLLTWPTKPPQELNRLDSKNWTPTPEPVERELIVRLEALNQKVDGIIILDQTDVAGTGVVTAAVLSALKRFSQQMPKTCILADSRKGLADFPPVIFKMNAAELSVLTHTSNNQDLNSIRRTAATLARANQRAVFVTLAERGMVGAGPGEESEHVSAWPLRGEIDVVGAGDAVSANLVCALCAGANLREVLDLASAAASIVIHKLGTTGTASLQELQTLLFS